MTKEKFVSIINEIQHYQDTLNGANNTLKAIGINLDMDNTFIPLAVELLAEIIEDEATWIEWWLWEAPKEDKYVYLDNKSKINVNTPENLYDFLESEKKSKRK
ncbi:MAG: hypothetical protein PHU71_05745 [Candidatus Gracilibacteria bacterium]|nr:hypothetical protein [Candidatus Gracilibacteria bacterium]